MDFYAQVNNNLPTISNNEVAKDENLIDESLELTHTPLPVSDLLQDTGDSTITISNEDQTVSAENKSESNAIDYSKTREIPDVSLDNVLSKENPDETIQLSRENPENLSDNESERMVENEDSICNLEQVQDAFVFCPRINSIEMDSIMAQGVFQSEKEMSQMTERKHSIVHKITNITFDKDISTRSKLQATEEFLNSVRINNNEEEFYSSLNVSGIFSFEKKTLQ